jgi:hypothetical protein
MPQAPHARTKILDLLAAVGPLPVYKIEKVVKVSRDTIVYTMRNHCFVSGWERRAGNKDDWVPVYTWGHGPTPQRPPKKTQAQKDKRYKLLFPEQFKAIRRASNAKRMREQRAFRKAFAQLIGADKPRKPMKDFATPEPDEVESGTQNAGTSTAPLNNLEQLHAS